MYNEQNQNKMIAKWVGLGVGVFLLLLFVLLFFPIVVVPAGSRGVVFNNASGVESRILAEGTHVRIPFLESVITLPIKTQATSFTENAGSSDSQAINVQVTVNWRLNPARVNWIYQNVGDNDAVVANVLNNNVQDAVKASVSRYTVLDFQRNRENVRLNALTLLQNKVLKYGIVVDNLSFTNIQFSSEFNAAIEQAQVAQQQSKKAEYQVQTAKAEAEAAIAKAQGDAESQRLQQQTLTPEILQKLWISKWDGHVPQVEGNGSNLLFQIPSK